MIDRNQPYIQLIREKARRATEQVKLTEAEQIIKTTLKENPDHLKLLSHLADIYRETRRWIELQNIAEEMLRLDPRNYQALVNLATSHYRLKKFSSAREYLTSALNIKESGYLLYLMVKTLYGLSEYHQCLPYLQRLLEINSQDIRSLRLAAQTYKKLGQQEKALEFYEKVVQKEPEDKFSYREYLSLKTAQSSPQQVVEDLDRVMKVSHAAHNPHLHALKGDKLKALSKYQEAIQEYQRGLALEPENRYFLRQIGFCCSKLNDYPGAIKYLHLPFLYQPEDDAIRRTLIAAYQRTGQFEELLQLLQQTYRQHPELKMLLGIIRRFEKKVAENAH